MEYDLLQIETNNKCVERSFFKLFLFLLLTSVLNFNYYNMTEAALSIITLTTRVCLLKFPLQNKNLGRVFNMLLFIILDKDL